MPGWLDALLHRFGAKRAEPSDSSREPKTSPASARPQSKVQRFDSVAEIVELCRARHPNADVQTANEEDGFILRIREGSWSFETLIVHFEGEGCYAVTLPDE